MTSLTSAAPDVRSQPRPRTPRQGLPVALTVAVTLLSGLVYYALLTHGTFNPLYEQPQGGFAGAFFLAQAQAIVHGHLNVSPAQIPSECWVHQGRCYGYFGVTPSVLRIPFLPLLDRGEHGVASLYMAVALTLAVGSALGIASLAVAQIRRTPLTTWLLVTLALSLGPAGVLASVARPAVYEEAIAWSVAFALLGVYCFIRWWMQGRRRWAILLVLSLVLSANARPTSVALGVVLGVGIVVRLALTRSGIRRHAPTLLLAAAVAILPFATCVTVYWFKFHTLVPNSLLNAQIGGPQAAPWWVAIRKVDHNSLQGLRFLPTALVAFLRPDGVKFSPGFPGIDFRFGPLAGYKYIGIPQGSLYIESFSSVPDDMPVVVLVLIGLLVYGIRQARHRTHRAGAVALGVLGSPWTYCVLGTAGSCAVMLTQGVLTNRYLGDFFPVIVVVLALGARFLGPAVQRLPRGVAVGLAVGVTLLVAWAVFVNLGLEYRLWWNTVAPA